MVNLEKETSEQLIVLVLVVLPQYCAWLVTGKAMITTRVILHVVLNGVSKSLGPGEAHGPRRGDLSIAYAGVHAIGQTQEEKGDGSSLLISQASYTYGKPRSRVTMSNWHDLIYTMTIAVKIAKVITWSER